MRRVWTWIAVWMIAASLIGQTSCLAADGWQAGVAKVVITPQQSMWMSGYGSRDHSSEGTLHDLWAKALVLEDQSGHRAVLVTLDLVGIDRPTSVDACERLQSKYQLNRDQVALATSHTHTGPVVGENLSSMYFFGDDERSKVKSYTERLKDQIVDVVGQAIENIEPVTVEQGLGTVSFAVNRRNNREADVPQLREAGELKGPVDHELPVLTVRDENGQLDALVFGYACHATVLSFYQWSGDWPGFSQLEIERRHPGTVAMFWAGCGADQNPLPRRTVELGEEYGRQTADGIDEVLADGMTRVEGRLITSFTEIDLAFDTLPTRERLQSDAQSDNRFVASRATTLLKTLEQDGELAESYPYPVQVWGIGQDIKFVILGGEVVVDFSIRLKQELESSRTWVAGYANDVMAYIPSKRVLTEGGYEGETAMIYYGLPTVWSPKVEEHIVSTVHELVERQALSGSSSEN